MDNKKQKYIEHVIRLSYVEHIALSNIQSTLSITIMSSVFDLLFFNLPLTLEWIDIYICCLYFIIINIIKTFEITKTLFRLPAVWKKIFQNWHINMQFYITICLFCRYRRGLRNMSKKVFHQSFESRKFSFTLYYGIDKLLVVNEYSVDFHKLCTARASHSKWTFKLTSRTPIEKYVNT